MGLAFLENYLASAESGYQINYHFMSNSGMFLPLASLFDSQTVLLDPERGPEYIEELRSRPRNTDGDPVEVAYDDLQHYNDGIAARLGVGKYLLERAANETRWLETLPRSPVPVSYLWGLGDPVNPVRIANHVWQQYLNDRETASSFWYLPNAGHYPHRDQPESVACIVRMSLDGELPDREEEDSFMRDYARNRGESDPIYVGRSRIRKLAFPGAVEYDPDGYQNPF